MAQILDAIGRDVTHIATNTGNIKLLLQGLMGGKVGAPTIHTKKEPNEKVLEDIKDILTKIDKKFEKDSADMEEVVKELKKMPTKKGGGGSSGKKRKSSVEDMSSSLKETATLSDKIDKSTENTANNQEKSFQFALAQAPIYRKIGSYLSNIENAIMGITEKGGSALNALKDGLFGKEVRFIKDTRAVAYEISGITKETEGLQRAFAEIGKTSALTGMNRSEAQAAYLANLKKGIRGEKTALNLAVTQLNTENQIGVAAGSLSDEFQSWTEAGRMTAMQTAEMGRGIRDIALNTGLTGENLKSVVKSSGAIVNDLRAAANLSAATARNVMEMRAQAEKLGVGDKMAELQKAMASSANLLLSSSTQTKSILLLSASYAGRTADLMNGTIMRSKEGIRDMAGGLQRLLRQFGVESMDAIDQLSDSAKMNLNIQLQSAFNIQLGDVRNLYDSLNEAGKGMAERLADINKERQKNITLEERVALMERERHLKESASLSILTALDEAAKGARDMNEALSTFGERRREFEGDLNAMGHAWGSNADAARSAIQEALGSINQSLKKSGKSELKIDSSEIEKALQDPAALRELNAKLTKAQQEASTAAKSQLDPMSDMNQKMNELNDTMRNFSSHALQSLLALVGTTGLIAALLTTTAGKGLTDAIIFVKQGGLNLFGEGAKKAVEETTKIAAATAATTVAEKTGGAAASAVGGAAATTIAEKTGGAAASAASAVGGGPAAAASGGINAVIDQIKGINAKNLLIAAAKLAAIGVALVALAAVVMTLSRMILGVFQLDTKTIVETGIAIAALLVATGIIAGAVLGAALGLEALGKMTVEIDAMIPDIIQGAVTMAMLVPPIVALAVAVIWMCRAILGLTGMDAGVAAKTAFHVGVILASVGLIAAGVLAAAIGLEFLGPLAAIVPFAAWSMLLGASALLMLTPAVLAAAAAVMYMSTAFMAITGLNMKFVATTVANLAIVIGSLALIAIGVLAAAIGLEFLAPLAFIAPLAVISMGIGTSALLMLTPAVLAAAAAVIWMAKGLMSITGLDASVASQAAFSLGGILFSLAMIAGSIIAASVGLSLLAAMALAVPILIPLMIIGTSALMMLTPAVLAAAAAVMWMAKGLMAITGIDKSAAETANNLSIVLDATASIAKSIISSAASLALLAPLALIAPLVASLMWVGASALGILAIPVLALAASVMALGAIFTTIITAKDAVEIRDGMVAIFQASDTIVNAVFDQMPFLMLLGALGFLAPYVAGLMWVGVGAFLILAKPVAVFALSILALAAVFRGAFAFLGDPKCLAADIEAMGKIVLAMSKALGTLPVIIDTLNNKIAPLMRPKWFGLFGSSKMTDALTTIRSTFKTGFKEIAVFCDDLINVIFYYIGDPNDMVIAGKALEGMAKVLTAIPLVIAAINGPITKLITPGWWPTWLGGSGATQLSKALTTIRSSFRTSFKEIAIFCGDLVDVIFMHIGDPNDMIIAGKALEGMAKVLTAIPLIVTAINGPIARLMTPGWWPTWLGGSGATQLTTALTTIRSSFRTSFKEIAIFCGDLVDVIFAYIGDPNDMVIAGKALEGMAKVISSVAIIFTALNGPIAQLTQPRFFGLFGNSNMTNALNTIRGSFKENFKEIAAFCDDLVTTVFESIGDPNDMIIAGKALEGMGNVLTQLPRFMSSFSSIGVGQQLSGLFAGLGSFFSGGLIGPLSGIQGISEMTVAVAQMKEVATVLSDLATALMTISASLNTISGVNLNYEALERIDWGRLRSSLAPIFGGNGAVGGIKGIGGSGSGGAGLSSGGGGDSMNAILTRDVEVATLLQTLIAAQSIVQKDSSKTVQESLNNTLSSTMTSANMDRRNTVTGIEKVGEGVELSTETMATSMTNMTNSLSSSIRGMLPTWMGGTPNPPPAGGPATTFGLRSSDGQLQYLKRRNKAVHMHEQLHAATAGRYAIGGPKYEYAMGSDGNRYATGGHVSVDMSPIRGNPMATIAKMQTIRDAALAPSMLSGEAGVLSQADLEVAEMATRLQKRAADSLYYKMNGTSSLLNPASLAQFTGSGLASSMSTQTAQPQGMSDLHSKMQQQAASSMPMNVNIGSAELSGLNDHAEDHTQLLTKIVEGLDNLKSSLTSSGGGSGSGGGQPGDPRSRITPSSPANYGKLTNGLFNQGGIKGSVSLTPST